MSSTTTSPGTTSTPATPKSLEERKADAQKLVDDKQAACTKANEAAVKAHAELIAAQLEQTKVV